MMQKRIVLGGIEIVMRERPSRPFHAGICSFYDLEEALSYVIESEEILLKGKNGAPRPLGDWERRQLDVLVHGRWQAGKITHYATNYRPDQIEAEVTESTFSRIRSGCEFLEVEGADLRNGELIDINKRRGQR